MITITAEPSFVELTALPEEFVSRVADGMRAAGLGRS